MNTTNFPIASAVNGRSHCTRFFSKTESRGMTYLDVWRSGTFPE